MVGLIAKSNITVIVGLGTTGLSVARWLAKQGRQFTVVDSRREPPNLARLRAAFPDVACETGSLNPETLCAATQIVLSPGVALAEPAIAQAVAAGVEVVGDIELFARATSAPIVAITGSNAKSTVTTLVGEMARRAGRRAAVGGNLGTPALDLIDSAVELYVLELSSFQLETTQKLNAAVATVLNVFEDHQDRYPSMMQYHAAKQRVYFGARKVVVNRDDLLTHPPLAGGVTAYSFGAGEPDRNGFGLRMHEGKEHLAFEFKTLMPAGEVALHGRHNLINALAALAVGHAVGLPMAAMLQALREFKGLPHRCEWVAVKGGIDFFNDSKGTNVGATLVAIKGLARPPQKLVLIAGGEGKGADFGALTAELGNHVRAAVLIGRDAEKIAAVAEPVTRVIRAGSLRAAVSAAYVAAQPGDAVLLSPACASFDMFADYEDRGRQFVQAVEALAV